jgi:PAS domain S-box-containing protein
MTWYYIIYFISIVITAGVMGFIAWYSWRHREVAGASAYLWISLMVSLLAVFEGISMIGPSKEWAMFWYKLRYFPLAMIPPLWLIFTLLYAGKVGLLTKPRIAALFIEPFITQVMVWTGGLQGFWMLHDVEFHPLGPFFIAEISAGAPGQWFFVHLIYAYTLMMAGVIIVFVVAARMRRRSRGQALALIAGTLIMITGSLIPSLNLIPDMEINPIIPMFSLGSLIIAWGVYRFKFFKIKPFISEERGLPLRLAMVYLFLVLGTLSTGYLYYRFFEQKFKSGIERQLLSIADLKVNQLVHFRRERIDDAEMLFRNTSFNALVARFFTNPADVDVTRQVWMWLDSVRSSHKFVRALLIGADGTPRISSPYTNVPVSDDIKRESREVAHSGRIVFFDFYRSSKRRLIRLAVMVPLIGNGSPMGVLALIIDPSVYLYPMIQRWPVPTRTAETLLVRREGDYALFLNGLRFSKDSALRLRLPLTQKNDPVVMAVTGGEGITEGTDYRGKPVIAAMRAVPDSPWFLVSLINKSEAFEPVRERLWLMVALMAALLVSAGAGIGLIWRWQGERFYRERFEAAEALRKSEERFRALFEYSMVGKSLTAPDGKLLQVNQAFAHMLGYTIEEFRNVNFADITHPDDVAESREGLRCLLANERESYRVEKRYFHKNGGIVWADVSSCLLKDANGEPQYFVTSIVNITERRLAEEALKRSEGEMRLFNDTLEQRVRERTASLEESNREMEMFTYSVSHDLRTPLRAVAGYSSILLEDYAGRLGDEVKKILMTIKDRIERMGRLIDDLLAFSRLGRQELRKTEIDMKLLVKSVFDELMSGEEGRGVDLELLPLPPVSGDPSLMREVMVNLLSNAIKFTATRKNARIKVWAEEDERNTEYYVRDNGVGYDMSYSNKLFGVFERLHGTEEFSGTGVGLAIVKRIITRHGGQVRAEGWVNEGATFSFSIPKDGENSPDEKVVV